jgi:hypothetical protein
MRRLAHRCISGNKLKKLPEFYTAAVGGGGGGGSGGWFLVRCLGPVPRPVVMDCRGVKLRQSKEI